MGLLLLAAFGFGLVVFVGGFILGEREGVRYTERRWSDAVRRHADTVRQEAIESARVADRRECLADLAADTARERAILSSREVRW